MMTPMTPRRDKALSLIIVTLLSIALAGAAAAGVKFELKDQFNRTHTHATVFSGQPVVMLAGDQRASSEGFKAWSPHLVKLTGSATKLIGLTNLEALPFFVPKSSVTKKMKREHSTLTLLCDWEGEVYETFKFKADTVVIVRVYKEDGSVIGELIGQPTDANIARVKVMIEGAQVAPKRR